MHSSGNGNCEHLNTICEYKSVDVDSVENEEFAPSGGLITDQ